MNVFITKQPYRLYYLFIVLILSFMMSVYAFPDALDIQRYYKDALNYAKIYTLSQYVNFLLNDTFDFIYTASLFTAAKVDISLNIVTVFFLSLYYISLCEIIRLKEPVRVNGMIFAFIILLVPFVWIQAISRNAAAIAVFYFAILQFVKGRKFLGVLLCLISIFTHISMIIWVLLAGMALVLSKLRLSHSSFIIVYCIVLVIAFFIPRYLVDIMNLIAGSAETRYASYANGIVASPLKSGDIGYGDKLPMICICMSSIYLVLVNNKFNFFYWMLCILSVGLFLAIFSNLMLTNRIIMLLPVFIGCNICAILRSKRKKYKTQIYILSMICVGSEILHLWSHRQDLFS